MKKWLALIIATTLFSQFTFAKRKGKNAEPIQSSKNYELTEKSKEVQKKITEKLNIEESLAQGLSVLASKEVLFDNVKRTVLEKTPDTNKETQTDIATAVGQLSSVIIRKDIKLNESNTGVTFNAILNSAAMVARGEIKGANEIAKVKELINGMTLEISQNNLAPNQAAKKLFETEAARLQFEEACKL